MTQQRPRHKIGLPVPLKCQKEAEITAFFDEMCAREVRNARATKRRNEKMMRSMGPRKRRAWRLRRLLKNGRRRS